MAKGKLKKSILKKELRSQVTQKLETVFKDLEALVGKRKFQRKVRKAGKILTTNVKINEDQPIKDILSTETTVQ